MNVLLVLVGLSVFCGLQGIFWLTRGRSTARASALLERLGGAASINEVSLLRDIDETDGILAYVRQKLQQAGEAPDITPFIYRILLWGMLGGLLGLILLNSLGAGLAGALVGLFLPFAQLSKKTRMRAAQISKGLPEALQVLTISLKAGHALPKAMATTAMETPGALGEELQVLAEELALGRSVEEAFMALGQRLSQISVVRTLVVSVIVLQQTGGNLIEVLDQLVGSLHEQSQYARKLAAMTAEGRMSALILSALPPVFLLMVYLVAPDYMSALFRPGLGLLVFAIAAALYFIGFFWVRRMVQPEVG